MEPARDTTDPPCVLVQLAGSVAADLKDPAGVIAGAAVFRIRHLIHADAATIYQITFAIRRAHTVFTSIAVCTQIFAKSAVGPVEPHVHTGAVAVGKPQGAGKNAFAPVAHFAGSASPAAGSAVPTYGL